MTLKSLSKLCDDFIEASGFLEPEDSQLSGELTDEMTESEALRIVAAGFTAMGGGIDDANIELAEVFAKVACRINKADAAAAYVDVLQTDENTADELRQQYAPNMALLVELARK